MHIGGGRWIVVDSFIDSRTKQPVALSYLSLLGVDAAAAIRLFIVTHWHDDHMRGASRLLASAANAIFCCSIALSKDEFSTIAAQLAQRNDPIEALHVAGFRSASRRAN